MIIKLPAQLNPISRRKDKSVKLSYETRELTPSETMTLMSMEGEEGHLLFSTNDIKEEEIPKGNAELGSKTQSERMKAVLYKLYLQDTTDLKFIGDFPAYYKNKTEMVIEKYKSLLKE